MKIQPILFLTTFLCLGLILKGQLMPGPGSEELVSQKKAGRGCSVFTLSLNDKVLFCGNLDHPNPDGYIRFWPESEEGYGGMLHGYFAQIDEQSWIAFEGGMNEKGLSFDTNGLPDADMNPHPEKPYSWDNENIWYLLLKKCSNVDDAINMARKFDFGNMMDFQVHVADSSGDAVVISPGANGELSFTRKEPGTKFLVSTNINNANPEHGYVKYPCRRHEIISGMLGKIENERDVNNDYLASVLDTVHFERATYNTIYSYICDLKKGLFYLYYFHQFNESVLFDLDKEVSAGDRTIKIADLVSQETRDNALKEYQEYIRIEKEKADRK